MSDTEPAHGVVNQLSQRGNIFGGGKSDEHLVKNGYVINPHSTVTTSGRYNIRPKSFREDSELKRTWVPKALTI